MPLQLTDTQLDEIAQRIYILRDPQVTRLPEPISTTGSGSLADALSQFDVPSRFPDMGIGIAYFPNLQPPETEPAFQFRTPRIWLHNAAMPMRIASTAKVLLMLAAVQLREDVRAIQRWNRNANVLQGPADYDRLFAMPQLWKRATVANARQIAGSRHAPRISTILRFDGAQAEFTGPVPGSLDGDSIFARLSVGAMLSWEKVKDFGFSELLWLSGRMSDNIASTSCVSEIGVAYIKAVQRAYGLFSDAPSKLRMLLGGGFTDLDPTSRVSAGSMHTHRPLQHVEVQRVQDVFKDPKKKYGDHESWVGGTAAALLAYLIALSQDRFAPSGADPYSGADACAAIRVFLNGTSPLVTGVKVETTVMANYAKVGFLGALAADFAYLETMDVVAGSRFKLSAYGIVATNVPRVGVNGAIELGARVHRAMRDL
jgi:hypothetical protein